MRLGDLGVFKSGGTPSRSKKEYWGGEYPWISSTALGATYIDEKSASDWVSEEGLRRSTTKLIKANSVMVGIRVSVGKCAINSVPMCTSQDVVSIEGIDEEQYDLPYLLALINSKRSCFESIKRGTTIQGITTEAIQSIPVPNIGKDEQKRISGTLENVDNMGKLYRKQLSALDALVKSRFIEMFGDPVTNPKRWGQSSLGEICNIGSSKRIFEKEYVDEGIPFYRTKEIVELSKGNPITTELFISFSRFKEIKERYGVPSKGDLLISAVGTIGVIWIADGKQDFYFKDGNLLRVAASDRFNSVFMKFLLEMLINHFKRGMSAGTAYAALTIDAMKKMSMPDIPIDLQNQFAAFVAQADKSRLVLHKLLEKQEMLRAAFMQEHFG